MSSQLPVNYHAFKGDIWRLLPDEFTGIIGVEVRDTATLQVYFCLVKPGCSELLLDHFQLPEKWWTGLAGFNEQALYLNGFEQTGQIGQPKGITAVAIDGGQVLFELPSVRWEGKTQASIFVSEVGVQPPVITEVHAFSGKVLNSLPATEVPTLQESTAECVAFKVLHPEIYEEGSAYFEELATFLLKDRAHAVQSPIEYLEVDSCFILSYYVLEGNGLFVKILVTYTLNGAVLYEYRVMKDAERIGGAPFFVQAGRLFSVQDKNVLFSVSLP